MTYPPPKDPPRSLWAIDRPRARREHAAYERYWVAQNRGYFTPIATRVDTGLYALVRRAAREEGITIRTWIERAFRHELGAKP
ncbi:MAG: hypothetical protein ACREEC_01995 [Thermoplasmata archaeon]